MPNNIRGRVLGRWRRVELCVDVSGTCVGTDVPGTEELEPAFVGGRDEDGSPAHSVVAMTAIDMYVLMNVVDPSLHATTPRDT
jgi:hypothetical protein